MKPTAEEFLKERCPLINDPKGISHFTGDFVIQMMEQYAALPPTDTKQLEERIKLTFLRFVSIESKWDEINEEAGPPKLQGFDKAAKAIASLIVSNSPQPQEEAEKKERYDDACIWLTKQNTKEVSGPMMLTLFKALQIASGYTPSKPNQEEE